MNKLAKGLSLSALVFTLAGCAEQPPLVSGFNGHSVEVQQSTIFTPPNPELPEVKEQAARICGKVNKRAEFASYKSGPDNIYATHLFLCL